MRESCTLNSATKSLKADYSTDEIQSYEWEKKNYTSSRKENISVINTLKYI